jgi:hypothetical protein
MKIILLSLLILLISISSFAQVGFFMHASGGYTIIPSQETSEILSLPLPSTGMPPVFTIARIKEYYEVKPSFEFIIGIHKPFMKHLDIETGLGVSYLGYERNTEVSDIDYRTEPVVGIPTIRLNDYPSVGNVNHTPIGETTNSASLYYAKLPLNVFYTHEKIAVGAGVSMSVLLHSIQNSKGIMLALQQVTVYDTTISSHWGNVHYDSITIQRTVPVPYEFSDKSGKGLTALLIAGNVSVRYNIFKKLWVNTTYYHSFSPIYTEKYRIAGKTKNRSVMIGLRYYL